jgi:hypothetical protein
MMFKALGMDRELPYAHVCSTEAPVSTVMTKFFEFLPEGYA